MAKNESLPLVCDSDSFLGRSRVSMENILRNLIIHYISHYPALKQTSTIWQEPLIGFAAANVW